MDQDTFLSQGITHRTIRQNLLITQIPVFLSDKWVKFGTISILVISLGGGVNATTSSVAFFGGHSDPAETDQSVRQAFLCLIEKNVCLLTQGMNVVAPSFGTLSWLVKLHLASNSLPLLHWYFVYTFCSLIPSFALIKSTSQQGASRLAIPSATIFGFFFGRC